MGAGNDLLGSCSELTCVTFLLSSTSIIGWQGEHTPCAIYLSILVFPLTVLSMGLIVSVVVNIIGSIFIWI